MIASIIRTLRGAGGRGIGGPITYNKDSIRPICVAFLALIGTMMAEELKKITHSNVRFLPGDEPSEKDDESQPVSAAMAAILEIAKETSSECNSLDDLDTWNSSAPVAHFKIKPLEHYYFPYHYGLFDLLGPY